VTEALAILMQVSLVVFMAGSLLGMGLALKVEDALTGLADLRFGALVLLLGFGMGPAVAFCLSWLLRLDSAYAAGLMLLGLTPCAPFLSALANRAGGNKTHIAANLLISAAGTILLLPLAVPVAVPGLTVDAWTIARPLLLIVLLPMLVGMMALRASPAIAARSVPVVKVVTSVATVIMLAMCALIYGKGLAEAVGTRAIAAQALFFPIVTSIAYACGTGLASDRRSVLTLGICTRNIGAALAPLLAAAAAGADQRMVVMVVMGVPLQLIFALSAASWLDAKNKVSIRTQN
jgi:BASS family bile acid:Na+ symporter